MTWIWISLAVLVIGGIGSRVLLAKLGAASRRSPHDTSSDLSPRARDLVARAFDGLDPARLVDYHVHVAGNGSGGTGCCITPQMLSWRHPIKRVQMIVYMAAAGVRHLHSADVEFIEHLVTLVRTIDAHGRHCLLAFDRHYGKDGEADDRHSELYVPNEYVWNLCAKHPDLFVPVISVHPYRKDALEELDRFGARGARIVKWLPNAMGMDPADPRCDAFYDRMAHWRMALLTHVGVERAVDSAAGQDVGNPLRLRRPLERGVKVIAAHCGSLGKGVDLDHPGAPDRPNFELFLRMMGEPRYEGLLFGELSAVGQSNRGTGPIGVLLERADLHSRLVNGSDWPLPAINVLYSTKSYVRGGYITAGEGASLREVYDFNPLLFDLVLKRTLKHPRTGARFPASVFHAHPKLGP